MLLALGYSLKDDGYYEIDPVLRGKLKPLYLATQKRLIQSIVDSCGPLADSLGLAYVEISPGNRLGIGTVEWLPFSKSAAASILMYIASNCMQDESPTHALERLSRARGTTKILFQVADIPYELSLGADAMVQVNLATRHVRSVSCFAGDGKALEPGMLICGNLSAQGGQQTRKDDRDTRLSLNFGEKGRFATEAFGEDAFKRIEPDSEEFRKVAKLVRTSIPLRDDWITLGHHDGDVPSTDPSVKVVAVHKIINVETREIYALKKEQLTKRRGEDGVNEQWALHGSSLAGVLGIARNGAVLRPRNAEQFGIGMYFSPAGVADKTGVAMMALSPQYSSPDASGLQHMLLCRVLCGSQETLKDGGARGSSQFQPSSADFDSGVDNKMRPVRILMWGASLSTHVLPEFLVSVRVIALESFKPATDTDGVDSSLELCTKPPEISSGLVRSDSDGVD
jgi:hypothetical protein